MMDEIIELNGVKYKRIEEPTPKYKVGDWVKVVENKLPRLKSEGYIGEIAKIDFVYGYGFYKRNGDPVQAYGIGKLCVVYEDELEPAEEPKKDPQDPFDINEYELYYYVCTDGTITSAHFNFETNFDTKCKNVANACKDKDLMKQRAMHEVLNRLLWRASVIAGEMDNEWEVHKKHYYIYKDSRKDMYRVWSNDTDNAGLAYFPTEESAKDAIKNIIKPFIKEHPDFVW